MDRCKKIVTHKKAAASQIKYSTEMCENKGRNKEKVNYDRNNRQKGKFIFCACTDNIIFSYDGIEDDTLQKKKVDVVLSRGTGSQYGWNKNGTINCTLAEINSNDNFN